MLCVECDELFVKGGYAKIEDGFEYMMKLPVSSFTADQIAKHEKQLAELKAEIERLRSLKAADMWLSELSVL